MTKQAGLGDNLYVDGYNISGDVGSLSAIASPAGVEVVTGIDKSAIERLRGLLDGRIDFSAWFNPATGRAHDLLAALPTEDRIVTYARGTAIGSPAAAMVAKQIDYSPDRATSGALTIAVSAQANSYGLEWGRQLTAGFDSSLTAAGAFDSLDYGAAVGTTAHGLQAYMHGNATGTDATVAIQHSDDDGATDPWANVTDGVFPVINIGNLPPLAMRLQTGRTESIKRWLRVNVTGSFTASSFSVVVVKNQKAVALP